jgi:hypothetical protein
LAGVPLGGIPESIRSILSLRSSPGLSQQVFTVAGERGGMEAQTRSS